MKLIIDNRTKLSDEQALLRVVQTVGIAKTATGFKKLESLKFIDGFLVRSFANKNSMRFEITKLN